MRESPPTIHTVTENDHDVLSLPFDDRLHLVLKRLNFWGKFLGIANILTGAVYFLGFLISAIPIVLVGILQIILGFKLVISANQFKDFSNRQKPSVFIDALENLRSYLFLNSILISISFILLVSILAGMYLFGTYFWELWNRDGDELVLSLWTSVTQLVSC